MLYLVRRTDAQHALPCSLDRMQTSPLLEYLEITESSNDSANNSLISIL